MKLKVNKDHKKADLKDLKIKRSISLGLATIVLSVSLFSGCNIKIEKIEHIPNVYESQLEFYLNDRITISGLENLKELSLNINNDKDLSWLNKCINLEKLSLIFNGSEINDLNDVINLPKLKELDIRSINNNCIFDANSFPFLKNNGFILETLKLDSVEIDVDFLESFGNLSSLSLGMGIFNKKIDLWKFDKLSFLDFGKNGIYDVAMFLGFDDCMSLLDKNITILANNGQNVVEDLKYIDDELNDMISDMSVSECSSDKEKLNQILITVLKKLVYDPNLTQYKEELASNAYDLYYENGYLYGALTRLHGYSICGNYAALFQALATRLGLESYFIRSKTHAFNLVNIDSNYFYTDPTFLDGTYDNGDYFISTYDLIEEGRGEELDWYLENPNDVVDEQHKAINLPSDVKIKKEQENKYSITIDGFTFYVSSLVLVSFLLVLVKINGKKNNKQNKKGKIK